MKKIFHFALFLSLLVITQSSLFSSNSNYSASLNNDLFNELKLMCNKDQEARFQVINSQDLNEDLGEQIISQVDQENLPHLKNIIYQFGWPGFQLVGEEGAEYTWLLVQHCDQDLEFQKECLILLEEAVFKKDAPKKHLAYLMDRVLVNEGKEQIYGTQLKIINGLAIPFPIKESHELDERRQAMGLCPFSEYLMLIKEIYHLENK